MAFIYHYFNNDGTSLEKDVRSPILFSIASLRNFYKDAIYVIDKTPDKNNWKDYPNRFNFKIIKSKITHPDLLTSKTIDISLLIEQIQDEVNFYSDADVIWHKDGFKDLKVGNRFYSTFKRINFFIRSNSGFYFFKKNTIGHAFFKKWVDLTKKMLLQEDIFIKNEIKKYYGDNIWTRISDESLLTYLATNYYEYIKNQKLIAIVDDNYKQKSESGLHLISKYTKDKIQYCKDNIINLRSIIE